MKISLMIDNCYLTGLIASAYEVTGVVSSNPALVTIKTPLVREATGNHLMNPTSLGKKPRALSLVSAKLKIELALRMGIGVEVNK